MMQRIQKIRQETKIKQELLVGRARLCISEIHSQGVLFVVSTNLYKKADCKIV